MNCVFACAFVFGAENTSICLNVCMCEEGIQGHICLKICMPS